MGKKIEDKNLLEELTIQDLYYYYESCYKLFDYYDNLYRSVKGSYPGEIYNQQEKEYGEERSKYVAKLSRIREEMMKRLSDF